MSPMPSSRHPSEPSKPHQVLTGHLLHHPLAFSLHPLAFLLLLLAACRPAPPLQFPAPSPVVRAFAQFSPGDTLELVQIQLGLSGYEVRYRSSMPPDQMGMVYFLDEGNLHIDVKKIGDTWVLITVPFLEPSTIPAADRVADWDRGADSQNRRSASQR